MGKQPSHHDMVRRSSLLSRCVDRAVGSFGFISKHLHTRKGSKGIVKSLSPVCPEEPECFDACRQQRRSRAWTHTVSSLSSSSSRSSNTSSEPVRRAENSRALTETLPKNSYEPARHATTVASTVPHTTNVLCDSSEAERDTCHRPEDTEQNEASEHSRFSPAGARPAHFIDFADPSSVSLEREEHDEACKPCRDDRSHLSRTSAISRSLSDPGLKATTQSNIEPQAESCDSVSPRRSSKAGLSEIPSFRQASKATLTSEASRVASKATLTSESSRVSSPRSGSRRHCTMTTTAIRRRREDKLIKDYFLTA